MSQQEQPRYFHLLSEQDLDELRDVLERIRDRRAEVLSEWYRIYLAHFGDQRSLSEAEFRRIFEPALLRSHDAMLRKDMDGYAATLLLTGKELAESRLPLDEMIATVQFFDEAARSVLQQRPLTSTAVEDKFDRLSHIRIILLVWAYMRVDSASGAARIRASEFEARNLPPEDRSCFHGLVGRTPAMRRLYRRIEEVANNDRPLLIVGETGSGKELIARAVHECGRFAHGPFTALQCTALPASLIENELFGYRRANLNGGQEFCIGLYRSTEGGTLLLQEITALPAGVQERLVRTIHASESAEPQRRVRIVASISHDPQSAVSMGQLRGDFFRCFRDHVMSVPPLRERRADLGLLTRHFIDVFNDRMLRKSRVVGVEDAAVEAMERYSWPGNVQELHDVIEAAFECGRSPIIGLGDLPDRISGIRKRARSLPTISFETFADAECAVLKRALEMTGGNKVQAAKMLKISRKKLYSGIAKYGIKASAP